MADGIKSAADAHGYRLLMTSAFLSDHDEQAALDTFVDFNVDGIVLTGSRIAARGDRTRRAVDARSPS